MSGEADSLLTALAELVVRRHLPNEEFAYVFLASGEEVQGKKAIYKRLKAEAAVFESLREAHQEEEESDLAFDSRALKQLNTVPFEAEAADTGAVLAAAEAAMATSSLGGAAGPRAGDYETATREQLGRLVARRRLEGGEFTYVYLPLSKAVSGKKALFNFLKNQAAEYAGLVKACKKPTEELKQFEARVLQQILVVPYEKEVEEMETEEDAAVGGKRKNQKTAVNDPKKAKLNTDSDHRTVFFEVEVLSSGELPCQLTQVGAVVDGSPRQLGQATLGPDRFLAPVVGKQLAKLGDGVLGGLGFTRADTQQQEKLSGFKFVFKRGKMKTELGCVNDRTALESFIAFLAQVQKCCNSTNVISIKVSIQFV
jgi:hypothetical protein